jgi:hypothetical protein
MSYLRALLSAKEYSQRGFDLTSVAVLLLPSNYTAWYYRRECLDAIGGSWSDELEKMIEISKENPKTYQVWQHRKMCISKLMKPEDELAATSEYIINDQKNYHVWGYRQWLLRNFAQELSWQIVQKDAIEQKITKKDDKNYEKDGNIVKINDPDGGIYTTFTNELMMLLSQGKIDYYQLTGLENDFDKIPLQFLPIWSFELSFCNHLLNSENDLRNNSAWNQRMFVLNYSHLFLSPHPLQYPKNCPVPVEIVQKLTKSSFRDVWFQEVHYTLKSFGQIMNNESAYNYLHGLCTLFYKYDINVGNNDSDCPNGLFINDNKQIISPGLGYIFKTISKLHLFNCSKQLINPVENFVHNRFLLSFLFDFLLILVQNKPQNVYSSGKNETIFGDIAQNGNNNNNNNNNNHIDNINKFEQDYFNYSMTVADLKKNQDKIVYAADINNLPYPSPSENIDIYNDKTENDENEKQNEKNITKMLLKKAIQTATVLTSVDPIRAKYWTFRIIQVQETYSDELQSE